MKIFNTKPEEELFSKDTVIEHGMVMDALSLSGSCGLVVRGIVKAAVDVDADVLVDSSGTLEGDVNCTNCVVKGRVTGNISASGTLTITEEGAVYGDITCATLQVSLGGNFQGCCNHVKHPQKSAVRDIFVLEENNAEGFV